MIFFTFSAMYDVLDQFGYITHNKDLRFAYELVFQIFFGATTILILLRFPVSIKNNLKNMTWCGIFDRLIWQFLFILLFFFYILWNAVLEVISIATIMCRKETKWEITKRSGVTPQDNKA